AFAFAAGVSQAQCHQFIDALKLFALGYSWGGYESLAVPVGIAKERSVRPWPHPGPGVRLQIGLEHPDDLIADLSQALARL
ncbi:MAG: cystathionine beta-lyase MetC, partial [Pseudomonadota bacterium]